MSWNIRLAAWLPLIFCAVTHAATAVKPPPPSNPALGKDTLTIGPAIIKEKKREDILRIPGAGELEVSIVGALNPNQEILRVYDLEQREIKRFSGETKNHEISKTDKDPFKFIVSGDGIKVTLNTEGATQRRGVTIKIKALSPVDDFTVIKNNIAQLVEKVATHGAGEAYQQIEENIKIIGELPKQMDAAKTEEKKVEPLIHGLKSISRSYAAIAAMRESIVDSNKKSMENLQVYREQTTQRAHKTKQQIQTLRNRILALQKQEKNSRDSVAQTMREVSLRGYQQTMRSLERQLEIWNEFGKIQDALRVKLNAHQQNLGLLLHILQINSMVYREASYVLELRKNLPDAQAVLTGLSDVVGVLDELEKSWSEVSGLKSKIQNHEFGS